jgi:hypothetical protein
MSPQPATRELARLVLACKGCGRESTVDGAALQGRSSEPLTLANVGRLYGRLRCSACSSREVQISDEAGRLLIDPNALTRCRLCALPIPLPRLQAMPGANTCAACAADLSGAAPPPRHPQPPADKTRCPRCGHPTVVRENEDQEYFLGCTGFPKCRWTAPFEG